MNHFDSAELRHHIQDCSLEIKKNVYVLLEMCERPEGQKVSLPHMLQTMHRKRHPVQDCQVSGDREMKRRTNCKDVMKMCKLERTSYSSDRYNHKNNLLQVKVEEEDMCQSWVVSRQSLKRSRSTNFCNNQRWTKKINSSLENRLQKCQYRIDHQEL